METKTPEKTTDSEVIIVGAGPAGATAAYYLAKAGHSVTLLERQSFPRDKVCGDFVGPIAIKELQDMGITQLPEFENANVIKTAAVFLDGQELIHAAMPSLSGLPQYGRVIPRRTLDAWVFEVARKAGATIIENALVTGFQIQKKNVKVTAKTAEGTRSFSARLLIGADGTNSVIAHNLRGSAPPKASRVVGIRGYYKNVQGPSSQADMHFASPSFPGYCWLFPTSETEANVGVGVLLETMPQSKQPKELLTELINQNEALKKRLVNAELKGNLETWPLNVYNASLPIVGDRVMLIGEAAGLVNPLNGEGIQYALLSGKWAAQTADSCLAKSDFSQTALSAYSKRVEGELGDGFKLSGLIVQLIRNRNLNPLWLRAFEVMVARANNDPQYATLAGAILSGMVPTSQGLNPNFMFSTLQEAAMSSGLRIVGDTIRDPTNLPKTAIRITQTGLEFAINTAQNPLGFFQWSMETGAQMAEYAASIPLQMLEGFEKTQPDKPQPRAKPNKLQIK